MSAAFSSCFRPSSDHQRRRRRRFPPPFSGCPNLTTSIYHTNFALFSLSWSQSLFSHSLLLHFHQHPNPFDSPPNPPSSSPISFRILIKPLIPWKKHGSQQLSDTIHVFWDLRRARFSSSPEPYAGFFIAVVVDGETTLLVGDMIEEAYARTRTANPQISQTLILKREHVIAHRIYTTKARFGGRVRDIEIDCDEESGLLISVDGKRVLQIKRLKWKFRGNERIEVAGVSVEVYWDVYDWVFGLENENRGNAVFMFRFEDEHEEQGNSMARQQNWNLGLNELEWRRMRSSLSSSSVSVSASISSVGSSAGASSSVMEWANSEDIDQIGAPLGFSLLIYAWRSLILYWDLYNWLFELKKENRENAVFMFKFEDEHEEYPNSMARQQNWNLGLNELEWRRMRSSLSSSSVSVLSVGSSAGASSSVVEWANSEDIDQIGAPLGFYLLIYAWGR